MKNPIRGLAAACAAAVLFAACNYDNSSGTQELPPTIRVISEPSGATLYIERTKMMLETPCNLDSTKIEEDDIVSIYKTGYVPYKGPLNDLPQVADRTYKAQLVK